MSHAEASYVTVRGRIQTQWTKKVGVHVHAADGGGGGDGVTLTVTIPPNVAATVHIPTASGRVEEAGNPGALVVGRRISGSLVVEVGSGTWVFSELA